MKNDRTTFSVIVPPYHGALAHGACTDARRWYAIGISTSGAIFGGISDVAAFKGAKCEREGAKARRSEEEFVFSLSRLRAFAPSPSYWMPPAVQIHLFQGQRSTADMQSYLHHGPEAHATWSPE